jgi:ketosteroid isomerase-like protein
MSHQQLIQGMYAAFGKGDIPAVLEGFDPKIEWREAEGSPYQMSGEAWIGRDAILQNLFTKLAEDWDGFTVTPTSFHDAGDSVVAEGRYTGTHKNTGKSIDMQFCHVWKLSGGKVKSFQQYCDTAQMQDATGSR